MGDSLASPCIPPFLEKIFTEFYGLVHPITPLPSQGKASGLKPISMQDKDLEKVHASAAIHWLVHKAFNGNVPKSYAQILEENSSQGEWHLRPQLSKSLTSAELYALACTNLFPDSPADWSDHESISTKLSACGFPVKDDRDRPLPWRLLHMSAPFHLDAHLHTIDSIMWTYAASILQPHDLARAIGRVLGWCPEEHSIVMTTPRYALQLWLNVICVCALQQLHLHDSLAAFSRLRHMPISSSTASRQIHDLLSGDTFLRNLAFGNRLALLVHFYSPHLAPVDHFQFHFDAQGGLDLPSTLHNAHVVAEFCEKHVANRPWHFAWPPLAGDAHSSSMGMSTRPVQQQAELLTNFARSTLIQAKDISTLPHPVATLCCTVLVELFHAFELVASTNFSPSSVRYLTYGIESAGGIAAHTLPGSSSRVLTEGGEGLESINFSGARKIDTTTSGGFTSYPANVDNDTSRAKGTFKITHPTSRIAVNEMQFDESAKELANHPRRDSMPKTGHSDRLQDLFRSKTFHIDPRLDPNSVSSAQVPVRSQPQLKETADATSSESSRHLSNWQMKQRSPGVNGDHATRLDDSELSATDSTASTSVTSLRDQFMRRQQERISRHQAAAAVDANVATSKSTWATKSSSRPLVEERGLEGTNSSTITLDPDVRKKLEQSRLALQTTHNVPSPAAGVQRYAALPSTYVGNDTLESRRRSRSRPPERRVPHRRRGHRSRSSRRSHYSSSGDEDMEASDEDTENDDLEYSESSSYSQRSENRAPRSRRASRGGGRSPLASVRAGQLYEESIQQISSNLSELQSVISKLSEQQQRILQQQQQKTSNVVQQPDGGLSGAYWMYPPHAYYPHAGYPPHHYPAAMFPPPVLPVTTVDNLSTNNYEKPEGDIERALSPPPPPQVQPQPQQQLHLPQPVVEVPPRDVTPEVSEEPVYENLPGSPTLPSPSPALHQTFTKAPSFRREIPPGSVSVLSAETFQPPPVSPTPVSPEDHHPVSKPVRAAEQFFVDLNSEPAPVRDAPRKPPAPNNSSSHNDNNNISSTTSRRPAKANNKTQPPTKIQAFTGPVTPPKPAPPPASFEITLGPEDDNNTGSADKFKQKMQKLEEKRRQREAERLKSESKKDDQRSDYQTEQMMKEEKKQAEKKRREAIFQAYQYKKAVKEAEELGLPIPPPPASLNHLQVGNSKPGKASKQGLHPSTSHPAGLAMVGVSSGGAGIRRQVGATSVAKLKRTASFERKASGNVPNPLLMSQRRKNSDSRGSLSAVSTPRGMGVPPLSGLTSGRVSQQTSPTHTLAPSEYNGPKLFVQPKAKSNLSVIINAISHCCLAGSVNENAKTQTLQSLSNLEGCHVMILLRGGCQYRGCYTFDIDTESLTRVSGVGPKFIANDMVQRFFKYNSGAKRFTEILSTKHLSPVVDAVMIYNHLWKPASSTSSSRAPSASGRQQK